jgi:hypothetical protein
MKKIIVKHTATERLQKRRLKRKKGPAALKRAAKRAHLQPRPVVATESEQVVQPEK